MTEAEPVHRLSSSFSSVRLSTPNNVAGGWKVWFKLVSESRHCNLWMLLTKMPRGTLKKP